ncbi:MAG: hypothetical protein PHG06_00100 [Parabacteroides sp.]|nr:hypothetical protein [Parabacteroides sp.]
MEFEEFNLKFKTLHEKEERLMAEIQSVQNERGEFYKLAVKDGFVFESVSKTWNKE